VSRASWTSGLLGVALALIGVWGAWVPHRAAALVLSGWDLAEFVKFLPDVSATRELFYLPVWCASLALVILAARPPAEPIAGPLVQAGLTLTTLGLMVALLPPYPDLLTGYQSAEFRWRFLLGLGGILLVALTWLLASPLSLLMQRRRGGKQATVASSEFNPPLSTHLVGGLLLLLALVGALPSLWQFLTLRGAIAAVYGANLGWGWGLGLFLAGWVLLGATGGLLLLAAPRRRA
jgi:hypothetical protein